MSTQKAEPDTTNDSNTAPPDAGKSATEQAASVIKPAAKPSKKSVAKPAAKTKPTKPAGSATEAAAATTSAATTTTAAKPEKPETAPASAKVAKKTATRSSKPKKARMIRDSFTMPEDEYGLIAAIKRGCLAQGIAVKKSEILRAAIIGFAAQTDTAVTSALKSLASIKTGRPPKGQKQG